MSDADEKRKERQQLEQQATALAMMFIAEEIPGLGELMMAGIVLDYIDPYGYNNTLDRSAIDKFTTGMAQGTKVGMSALIKYLENNGDTSKFTDDEKTSWSKMKTHLPPDILKMYNNLEDDGKQRMINSLGSQGRVVNPINVNLSTLGNCLISDRDTIMEKNCKDNIYKKSYLDFWNNNKAKFEKDAKDAAKKSLEGLFSDDNKKKSQEADDKINSRKQTVIVLICIISALVIGMLIYILFFWNSKKITTSITKKK